MRTLIAGILTLFLTGTSGALAAEIEGVRFPETRRVDDTTLVLHNVGLLRWKIFFKGLVGGLYLGEGVPPADVLADVPKRLELHYFWSIDGDDFGEAANEILTENFPEKQLRELRPKIDRLNALYEDVEPGDRYALTYIPGRGTTLSKNGRDLGRVEGAELASVYFAVWFGSEPMDDSLKNQLLAKR